MVNLRFLIGVLAMGSIVLFPALSVYGQGDINDLDKIGHRNVAHRCMVSSERERAVGEQIAEKVEKAAKFVQDPAVEQYVTTLADNVIRNSDLKGPVVIKVARSPQVASNSLPGGFIYLTSSLLLVADNDDEVAGAIAHQVAHAAARHWASQITKMSIAQYAMAPLMFPPTGTTGKLPPKLGSTSIQWVCAGFLTRGSDAVDLMFLKFSRNDELEADYLGLQYVYKAGYDPNAYIVLLRKLAPRDAASQDQPDTLRAVPPLPERVAQAEKEIKNILSNAPQPKASPEFVLMKSRL